MTRMVHRNGPESAGGALNVRPGACVMIANKLKRGLQLAKRWSFQQKTLVCSGATCDSPLSMALSYHRWALCGKKANRSVSLLEKQPWYPSRTRWEQLHST